MLPNDRPHPQLTYRLADLHDAPYLAGLINEAFHSERTGQTWLFDDQGKRIDIISTELITSFISSPDSVLLTGILKGSGLPVVCCYLRKPSDPPEPHMSAGAAWLGLLSVSPDHHKRGYGFAMLKAAERFVSEDWEAKRLEFDVVSSRTELRERYRRCGYEVTGKKREFQYGEGGREILAAGLELVVYGKVLGAKDILTSEDP